MHVWGDGFDFGRLNDAMDFLANHFKAKTGKDICMKEKYGTVRYEWHHLWLEQYDYEYDEPLKIWDHRQEFVNSLLATVYAFPDMAAELTNDCEFEVEDIINLPEDAHKNHKRFKVEYYSKEDLNNLP